MLSALYVLISNLSFIKILIILVVKIIVYLYHVSTHFNWIMVFLGKGLLPMII